MAETLQTIDRITPTKRPNEPLAGYQIWTDLLFVHWRLPAEMIAPLLPQRLTLDTWEGEAWVGMVPFYMSGVRPWWSPAVPGVSDFCETNLRTYVHLDGEAPGVLFLSLEATKSLAVRIGRRFWNLPYFKAEMEYRREGNQVSYRSRRLWPEPAGATTDIKAEVGELVQFDEKYPGHAVPETLGHFLAERYFLYSTDRRGRLYRGQVHHRPYPLREARVSQLNQTLLPAAGIETTETHCHALFSDGVEVEIFPLRQV